MRRERSMSILKGVQRDEALSPDNKVLFAETLREVRGGPPELTTEGGGVLVD